MLIRIIVAILACLLAFALMPLVLEVIGFPVAGNVVAILKLCIAGIALFYIIKGPPLTVS
jgi:hypothetical protein